MENEFLYKLNIDSNLSKVNEGLATFVKVGAGLTAFTSTAKLVANAFNEIDTLSVALGQDATYLRVIGQEFRLIGLSAQQGTGLVSNLSKEIRNISIGEGKLKELGMLGITDLDKIKTVQGFIGELRRSARRDIEAFRTFAPRLGLDTGQIKYLLQEQEDFKRNQKTAREQVVETSQSREEAKKLNESIAKLSASFERLGQSVLKLSTYLTPAIDTIGNSLFNLPENIGIITDKIGETIDKWTSFDENAKIPVEKRKKINIKVRDSDGNLRPIKTIEPIKNLDKIDTTNIRPVEINNIGKDKISDMSNSRLEIYNEILNKNKDPNVSNVNNSKKIENTITINVATADDGDKILKSLNELNGE